MAATEEKKYLINVESNLDEYTKEVQKSTEEVDKWKIAQKEAEEQSGKNSKEYIEATAQLKTAQKEQRQATATLEKMTTAQKSNGTSYNDLYKQWDAAQLKLKALQGTLVMNKKGQIELTEEYKEAAKEVAEAKKAINDFNKQINDGRTSVGLYGQAINDAFTNFGGPLGNVVNGFKGLKGGLENAKAGFTGLRGAIMASGIGALVIALMGLFQYFTKTKEGATFLSKATAALGAAFDMLMKVVQPLGKWLVSVFTEPQKALKQLGDFLLNQLIVRFNGLKKIVEGIGQALKGDFSKAVKTMGDGLSDAVTGVENFRDKVAKLGADAKAAALAAAALAEAQAKLAQRNVDASYSLANLSKQYETYRAIADDDTRSFKERNEAAVKADAANKAMMATRVSLAKEAYNLAQRELAQQKAAGKDTIEIQQKAADSYTALKEAESAYNASIIEYGAIKKKILSDELELRLDSIEKGLDGIKAVNVAAISDDKKTVGERISILKALTITRDEALANEIKLIEDFSKKQIDLADLVAAKDAVTLKQKIDNYQLSEKASIRLQDIVKNAHDTDVEFAALQKTLDQAALDRKKQFVEKQKEIIESIAATNRETVNKMVQYEIEDNAQKEINLTNKTVKSAEERNFLIQQIEVKKAKALRDIQLEQQLETDTLLEQQRKEKAVADINAMQIEAEQKQQLLIDAEMQAIANQYAIQEQYNAQKTANALQTETEITEIHKAQVEIRNKVLEGSLAVASDVFGALSELAGKQSKVGKALAITQALINTYQSATAAYSSAAAIPVVGWVLGPIAAAAAVAAGLANVAAIKKADAGGSSASSGGSSSGTTISSSFTAASPMMASSAAQQANAGAINTVQQNVNTQQQNANIVNAIDTKSPVLSVESFKAQEAKYNSVVNGANV